MKLSYTYLLYSRHQKRRLKCLGKIQRAGLGSFKRAPTAKAHAESEFEKYRVVQDRLFESDFDRMLKQIGADGSPGSDE